MINVNFRNVFVLSIAVILSFLACRTEGQMKVEKLEGELVASKSDVKVNSGSCDRYCAYLLSNSECKEVWIEHFELATKASEQKVSSVEFEIARLFFIRLTGKGLEGTGSYAGLVPNEKTSESLPFLVNWFERNGEKLVWEGSEKENIAILESVPQNRNCNCVAVESID